MPQQSFPNKFPNQGHVYVLTGGPTARNAAELKEQLGLQPQHEFGLQGFHCVERFVQTESQQPVPQTKEFQPLFARQAKAIVYFEPKQPLMSASMDSVDTVRLICHILSVCSSNTIPNSTILSDIRSHHDVIIDYIPDRGIGFIRSYGVFFDWFDDLSLMPLLLTGINLSGVGDLLKVIDRSGIADWRKPPQTGSDTGADADADTDADTDTDANAAFG